MSHDWIIAKNIAHIFDKHRTTGKFPVTICFFAWAQTSLCYQHSLQFFILDEKEGFQNNLGLLSGIRVGVGHFEKAEIFWKCFGFFPI